jgi:hypothetical protein
MTKELTLNFPSLFITEQGHFLLCKFLCQFHNIRVLRVNPFIREVGLYLLQDDGEAILPVLKEIEFSILHLTRYSDEEYKRCVAKALVAFEPFISSRK